MTVKEERAAKLIHRGAKVITVVLAVIAGLTWGGWAVLIVWAAAFFGGAVVISEKYLHG